MSDRIRVLTHKGHQILFVDNSQLKPAEILAIFPEVTRIALEKRIRLICTDVSHTTTDDKIKQAAIESINRIKTANGPLSNAVVGIRGIQKILANAMDRTQHFADTREEALDWLAAQAAKG